MFFCGNHWLYGGLRPANEGVRTSKTMQEAPKVAEERIAFDFPKDYKNWTHGTSKIILDKGSPLYGFQQVFVNDVALDSYKKRRRLSRWQHDRDRLCEAIEEGNVIKQGTIIWYAAMKKDARATKTSGWIFDGFDAKTYQSTVKEPVTGCYITAHY